MNLNKVDTDKDIVTSDNINDYINEKLKKSKIYLEKMNDLIDAVARNVDYDKNKTGIEAANIKNANHLQITADLCSKLISLSNSFFSNISSIQLFNGIEDNTYDFKDNDFVKHALFERKGDILHIKFPSLLPKKLKSGLSSGPENTRIKYTYTAAIKDYFSNIENRFEYKEKVVLCIIHHYPSEACVKDHDNYSLREIINCLSTYLFIDDNAKWLAHYQDYIVDGQEYSEIYIVPSRKFTDFINEGLYKM